MKRLIAILYILLVTSSGIFGQSQRYIDSLVLSLNQNLSDTSRVHLLNKIASDLLYVNSDKIYYYAQKANELSNRIDYKKGIAEAYNNLGIYYRLKGIYDKAIDYSFNSLFIMEDLNDMKGIARSYNLIGIIYFYLDNYELSLEYYNMALELNIKQNDKKWIAGNSNNLGMIYEIMGDYSKSLEYYFKSLETNIELKNINWIANNYSNIGSLYQKMGNPKCFDYYLENLRLRKSQGDIDGMANANLSIGTYFNEQNKYDSANKYLQRSYILADSIDALNVLTKASYQLSVTSERQQNYIKAFRYFKTFKSLNDSLKIKENSQKITRLEMQYKHKKSRYLEELEFQRTELIRISIAFFLIVIFVISVFIFGRQRARSNQTRLIQQKLQLENKLLQEELISKDKVLRDNIIYLVDKNELISMVSEKLIEQKSKFKVENIKIVNDIILELQSSTESDIWEEFELRFKQVHSNFYSNLKKQFPNLSANDKKLAAFLRLNMSSREISSLTNQSIASIETARSRLRKKLNIWKTDDNLSEFLQQF